MNWIIYLIKLSKNVDIKIFIHLNLVLFIILNLQVLKKKEEVILRITNGYMKFKSEIYGLNKKKLLNIMD